MVTSYGKCEMCRCYGMQRIKYYCEADTYPMCMCDQCWEEFDEALSSVGNSVELPWWADETEYV